MSRRGLRIISDAQLIDLRLQAWEEAQGKRASRVRKIDSDDILPEPAHPAFTEVVVKKKLYIYIYIYLSEYLSVYICI